jgi:hypothetical protein
MLFPRKNVCLTWRINRFLWSGNSQTLKGLRWCLYLMFTKIVRTCEVSEMSIPITSFWFDETTDSSITDLPHGGWTLAIGRNIRLQSNTAPKLMNIIREQTIQPKTITEFRIIDDSEDRKKIWKHIFKFEPMPEPKMDSIEKSYGLLDSCFKGKKIETEEVLGLLKKAK